MKSVFLSTVIAQFGGLGKRCGVFGIEPRPRWEFNGREGEIHKMSVSAQSLPTTSGTKTARSWAAHSATSALAPFTIERREPLPSDVAIEILYCGVCHSDLHQARNEWHNSIYPVVPGHEIVGRVTKVGSAVTKFRQGDLAAVGCLVGSCGVCPHCTRGLEQYCDKFPVLTYNGPDKYSG